MTNNLITIPPRESKAVIISKGIDVVIANDKKCIELMSKFIKEKPELWLEDIAEDD